MLDDWGVPDSSNLGKHRSRTLLDLSCALKWLASKHSCFWSNMSTFVAVYMLIAADKLSQHSNHVWGPKGGHEDMSWCIMAFSIVFLRWSWENALNWNVQVLHLGERSGPWTWIVWSRGTKGLQQPIPRPGFPPRKSRGTSMFGAWKIIICGCY